MEPWKCLEEKVFLDFPYVQIVERLCERSKPSATDEPHRFYVFRSQDWCNVIPVTEDGKIVVVRQFRAGTMSLTYEFPAGVVDAMDGDSERTALRELVEETGYEPTPNATLLKLGTSHPNPALQDNQLHSLLVGPVKKVRPPSLDPTEEIIAEEKTLEELIELMKAGQFSHALAITSLFFLIQKFQGTESLKEAFGKFQSLFPNRA